MRTKLSELHDVIEIEDLDLPQRMIPKMIDDACVPHAPAIFTGGSINLQILRRDLMWCGVSFSPFLQFFFFFCLTQLSNFRTLVYGEGFYTAQERERFSLYNSVRLRRAIGDDVDQ